MGSVVSIDGSSEEIQWEGAINKRLLRIDVTDVGELTDVIARVEWLIEFVLCEGVTSEATVRTELEFDDIDPKDFMPIQEMTQDKILSFCLAKQGGDEFIKHLLELHSEPLAQKYKEKDYRRFDINELPES